MKKVIFVIASSIIVSSVLYIKTQQEATAPKEAEIKPVSVQSLKSSLDSIAQSIIRIQRFVSENKDTITMKLFKQKKDPKILEDINTLLSKIQALKAPELITTLQKNAPLAEKTAQIQNDLSQNNTDTLEDSMKAILTLDQAVSNNILSELQALEPEKPKEEPKTSQSDNSFDDYNFNYDDSYGFDSEYSKPYESSYDYDNYERFLDI